jgi:hypothetical protein
MEGPKNPYQSPADINSERVEVDWLLFYARLIFVYVPTFVVLVLVVSFLLSFILLVLGFI